MEAHTPLRQTKPRRTSDSYTYLCAILGIEDQRPVPLRHEAELLLQRGLESTHARLLSMHQDNIGRLPRRVRARVCV